MSDFTLSTLPEALVTIISALGDEPNVDDGLTAQQLKNKFDEAPKNIRTFLNNTLIHELEQKIRSMDTAISSAASSSVGTARIVDGAVTEAKLANGAVTGSKFADGAVTGAKIAANAVSANFTATIGTSWTATGAPFTGQYQATGIVPEDESDPDTAITWACTSQDADVIAAYDLLSFDVIANIIKVSCDSNPEVDIPVTATQDGTTYSFTVLGGALTPQGAPFVQEVSVEGLLATDAPVVDIVTSGSYADSHEQLDAYGTIYKMIAGDDTLTVYADDETSVSVAIQIKAVRK